MPAARNSLPRPLEPPETLRFRVLGSVEARRGAALIELGGPLQRTLLACLLLRRGEVVSRERLIDVLWDDDPPPSATRSLETKASRLRLALGPDAALVARRGGYVLEVPPDRVDVERFQALIADGAGLASADPLLAKECFEQALSLWHGAALSGVPDNLLTVERARLEEQRLQAIEARIDADLALGGGAALVIELEELRRAHPLRERLTERLMVALYRSGRQADALQAYQKARRSLVDELGLEPGPRLHELEQAVLRHDESLGPLPISQRLIRSPRGHRALAAAAALCVALLILAVAIGSGGKPRRATPPTSGLTFLDAATGAVRSHVALGDSVGVTRFGYGFLWTRGENGVMSQLDPRSGKLVRSIPIGVNAADVAAGAGGVWVTDSNGPTLLRINPPTGQIDVRARLSSRGLRGQRPAGGIAIDAGSLWVARGSEAIDRLDPSTRRLQHRIRLTLRSCGTGQCALAAGAGRVWVAGGDNGTLTGVEEATGRVVSTTKLDPFLCCVEVGGGSVWVAEAHDVAQLSPQGRVLRRFSVGTAGVGDIAFDRGYLWATADTTGKVLRIRARDGHVRTTRVLGPIGIAASRGTVAVAARAPSPGATAALGRRVLRIGFTQDWLNITDPAVTRPATGNGRWQWQLQHAICAQLYQNPDANGPLGTSLQPELAAGKPRTSSDGRTWTIPLQDGLRFSPPLNRPVTAEDVRATIVRAFSPQLGPSAPAARVLREIVGLRAYRSGAASDVAGISVHRRALVIRTRRPIDDLAARLSLPYFCVLPAGLPTPRGGYQDPLPTAGPYYLAAHDGGDLAVLRRNPGYHGPRPQHLDALVFKLNLVDRTGLADVRRGRLDYFAGPHVAINTRVGCRVTRGNPPTLDLAALCLTPSHE